MRLEELQHTGVKAHIATKQEGHGETKQGRGLSY
jgi:hypothetical protein